MLTVPQADSILQKNPISCPSRRVPLAAVAGCVLREHVAADRDLPPFDRATMDGIAVNSAAFAKGVRAFPVEGLQKAGIPALSLGSRNACIEIMTGAMLPKGCDCVIPAEYIETNGGAAKVRDEFLPSGSLWAARPMINVHRKGSDARKGDILLRAGCRLLTAQIAVAAAVGKSRILVSKTPEIAVVGTGDELVEINRPVKPFQIRRSNTCALAAGLALSGYTRVKRFHIRDDQKRLRAGLKKILAKYDIVILSGGVSMGKLDFVPRVLKQLGVTVLFHKVRQRPGGPLLFGKTSDGKPVFGLPGNPVSTQICFYRYILPYLNKSTGLDTTAAEFAVLDEEVEVETPLTRFLPVKIAYHPDGRLAASPVYTHGSGDYASLAKSDGFVELKEDTCRFSKGSISRLYRW
ncbi:MAG: molybdopterin molybdotransferase MoeA [Candidatus Omnitrophica bacterium]|nr:molybdopterin molybdotransferase MoeA [Candidatus Omnitrophota bacterium]